MRNSGNCYQPDKLSGQATPGSGVVESDRGQIQSGEEAFDHDKQAVEDRKEGESDEQEKAVNDPCEALFNQQPE